MPKPTLFRNLTIINFIIVTYFGLLWLVYMLKFDGQAIGVVRELLSIPFLLALLVFLVIGIRHWIKDSPPLFTKVSVVALAICIGITIGSFF
ncbi:hypothetical protein [Algoriphagus sp.]|uniref:hypothetical protein n=1 Tax=Algoriphagus sp. TaxID=1872435 RepID=UPI0039198F74